MFKKILAVFIGFVCISNIAMATVDERLDCVGEGWARGVVDDDYPLMVSDYTIYFDNDEFKIPTDCSPKVDEIVQKLRKQKDDIDAILMFGSADATGTADHNANLARQRVNTVRDLLKGNGFTDEQLCGEAIVGNESFSSSHCARTIMGDSMSRANQEMHSFYQARAVFMYVIYKRDICGETATLLDELIKKIEDGDEKNKLKEVKNLCPNADTLLTQSERDRITKAILAAVKKYPKETQGVIQNSDISNKEKVRLLNNSIIDLGNEYNNNRSVWKTADGGFNYARLASDSIAGVVLGTAGGLITSKVVKKNQLKRGFENVSCTIGGQSVASYGDEFTVGFQELR